MARLHLNHQVWLLSNWTIDNPFTLLLQNTLLCCFVNAIAKTYDKKKPVHRSLFCSLSSQRGIFMIQQNRHPASSATIINPGFEP